MAKPKNKPLKRFNGQGTVYKLKGRRRRPWVAAVTTGYEIIGDGDTPEGEKKLKQTREIIGYYKEENEAKTALLMHNAGLSKPDDLKSTMTLEQTYDAWSKVKFNEKITKSTKDGIKASWKKFSSLKDRVFSELRSDDFQNVINEAKDEGASLSALTKMKSFVYILCEYAYLNSIIPKNFSSLVKVGEVETNEREAFTDLEVEIFKKNIDTVPWVDTILVLCYTGMRPVEMLTLTKFNVDMERKLITGGVKTDAGKNRPVPIHPLIYPIFQKWYEKNGETIFCNEKGEKLSVRAYREDRFAPALQTMGIRPLTPYSCRHTFATRLNRENAPSANKQRLIGHVVGSDTTDKVYTHPEIEDLRNTIEMLK